LLIEITKNKTMKPKRENHHDVFFKQVFSRRDEVVSFVKAELEPAILKDLDLESLMIDTNSYIDENLKEYFSDIVYNCNYKKNKELKLTLLFEHKTKQSGCIYLQLLRYMLNIWQFEPKKSERKTEEGRTEKGKKKKKEQKLPFVIPFVVYQGKHKWKIRNFASYFEGIDESLLKYLPDFKFLLLDLSQKSDAEIEEIYDNIYLQACLLLMKKAMQQIKESDLLLIFKQLDYILNLPQGEDMFRALLIYAIQNTDLPTEQINEKINFINENTGGTVMSTYDKLINQGIEIGSERGRQEGIEIGSERGRQEGEIVGIEKGKRIAAVNGFIAGLEEKTISIISGLQDSEISKLKQLFDIHRKELIKMIEQDKIKF